MPRGFQRCPIFQPTTFIDEISKILHAKDEKVWREGIALTNPSSGLEGARFSSINENRNDGYTT